MTQNDIADRLDALEAQLDDQQKTIERQQERIEAQEAIINAQQKRLDADGGDADDSEEIDANGSDADGDDSERAVLNRRTALQAGGVLGLLGLGAGTASADASGQIGTSSDPLQQLYTEELNGGVTGDAQLTNIAGTNLSIDSSGNLNASGGGSGAWVEGDNTNLLKPVSKDGIEVDTIADNGSGSVTMNSALDLTDNQINYGTNAGSQTLANLPFSSSQTGGSTNSYAMQLDGDDVLTVGGENDGSGNLTGPYVWAKKLNLEGTLNARGGTIENTTGALSLSTSSGDLDLQPSGNIDFNSNRISNAKDIHSDEDNITFKGSADVNLDGSILADKGGDMDIISTNSVNVDIDNDSNDTDGTRDFKVTKDGKSTDLFTVNDGGDVEVHSGNLDAQGGTVENTTGDLTLDANGSVSVTSSALTRKTVSSLGGTLNSEDYFVKGDTAHGNVTLTLPPDPETGEEHVIKRSGGNDLNISGGTDDSGNDILIDGRTQIPLDYDNESRKVIWGGSEWHIIGKYRPPVS